MAMKEYSAFPNAPTSLEPHQIVWYHIQDTWNRYGRELLNVGKEEMDLVVWFSINIQEYLFAENIAQSARAVEYTDCTSAER